MEQRNSSHIIVIVCIVGWQEDGRVAASVAKIPQCQTCSMLVHICQFATIFALEVVIAVTPLSIIASLVSCGWTICSFM